TKRCLHRTWPIDDEHTCLRRRGQVGQLRVRNCALFPSAQGALELRGEILERHVAVCEQERVVRSVDSSVVGREILRCQRGNHVFRRNDQAAWVFAVDRAQELLLGDEYRQRSLVLELRGETRYVLVQFGLRKRRVSQDVGDNRKRCVQIVAQPRD